MTCIYIVFEARARYARLSIRPNKPRSALKSRVLWRPRRENGGHCRAPAILRPESWPWVKCSNQSDDVRHGARGLDAIAELSGKDLNDLLIDFRDKCRPFVGRIAIRQHGSHRVHRSDVTGICNCRNEVRAGLDEFRT